MFRLFSGRGYIPNDAREAITLAAANDDKSMVPVMIEMLRFFGNRQLVVETHAAISAITAKSSGAARVLERVDGVAGQEPSTALLMGTWSGRARS